MARKLIIEIDKCLQCPECPVKCSYPYHTKTQNNGIEINREKAVFALICRRCETAPCVTSCPTNALKKDAADYKRIPMVQRASMLCIGCLSCTIACPFGVLHPDFINYMVSKCDLCAKRISDSEKPLCVETCPQGALSFEDREPDDSYIPVDKNILVHITDQTLWERTKELVGEKKKS